jgi:hypothetical protein
LFDYFLFDVLTSTFAVPPGIPCLVTMQFPYFCPTKESLHFSATSPVQMRQIRQKSAL